MVSHVVLYFVRFADHAFDQHDVSFNYCYCFYFLPRGTLFLQICLSGGCKCTSVPSFFVTSFLYSLIYRTKTRGNVSSDLRLTPGEDEVMKL